MPLSVRGPRSSNRNRLPSAVCVTAELAEDLAGARFAHDTGGEVDGDAADVVVALFDFADVDAGASFEAEVTSCAAKLDRCGDGFGARREGCESAVAGVLDDGSVVAFDRAAQRCLVAVERGTPDRVTACSGGRCRIDEIGEQHCDQAAAGSARPSARQDEFDHQFRDEPGVECSDCPSGTFDGDAFGVGEDAIPTIADG